MAHMGIPVKVLFESVGLIVTIETQSGHLLRGKLMDVEDNMNCQLADCVTTNKEGKSCNMQYVYVRGSSLLFMILPDMIKNAPMFTKIRPSKKLPTFGRGSVRGADRGRGRPPHMSMNRPGYGR